MTSETSYMGVRMTRTSLAGRKRTQQGISTLKIVTDAAQAGNTVSAKTEYRAVGGHVEEFMDAVIIWDA